MLIQHLKTSWRNLLKYKAFSLINIIGLAVGIFCVVIIMLWINYEIGFDRFHKNYNQLYRVVNNWGGDKGTSCPGALAKYLIDNYPEVENAATYSVASGIKLSFENENHWVTGGIADSTFFRMFSFPLIHGNVKSIFPEPNSAVITRKIAQLYFGKEDPIGKLMEMQYEDMVIPLHISGIVENIPENSSFQFDFLLSSAIAPDGYYAWTNNWPEVFVQLRESVSYKELSNKIAGLAKKHDKQAINSFELRPFTKEHLYGINDGGLINYVRIFALIAIVVLLLACFNYINLSTSHMINRQKEIGIKKVLGASKMIIQKQFMLEVFLIALIGLNFAYVGAKILLPHLNNLLNKNLAIEFNPVIYLSLFGIVVITSFISGIYPSFYLASLSPVFTINSKNGNKQGKKAPLRNILVVIQFSFTIILVIGLISVYNQISYMQNKALGFDKEGILVIPLQGNAQKQLHVIKEELLANPDIERVSGSAFHPVMQDGETSFINWRNKPENKKVSAKFNYVGYGYINTFNIKMKEGRFFSESYADNSSKLFVVNEELVKSMGISEPIGTQIALFGKHYGEIIGVMKNFHNESLHQDISEYVLMLGNRFNYLSVKLKSSNISETVDFIENKLKKIEPGLLFTYVVLRNEIESKYYQDILISKLTLFFTVLSIFISLLGLFGLVLLTTSQHKKEIGIRKVNGALTSDILMKLNFRFIKWVGVSFIISIPLSIIVINQWYSNFAYKAELKWWVFLLVGISVLVFTSIIVSIQSWRTACSNPVDSLRYE